MLHSKMVNDVGIIIDTIIWIKSDAYAHMDSNDVLISWNELATIFQATVKLYLNIGKGYYSIIISIFGSRFLQIFVQTSQKLKYR